MTFKGCRFLLVGDSRDDLWRLMLEEVTASLGTLQIAPEVDALNLVWERDYELIIIDTAKVEDVFVLVSCIRTQKPDARVLIATSSPTWKRAREAFRAGATDYTRKSLNREKILSELRAALGKTPPLIGR